MGLVLVPNDSELAPEIYEKVADKPIFYIRSKSLCSAVLRYAMKVQTFPL